LAPRPGTCSLPRQGDPPLRVERGVSLLAPAVRAADAHDRGTRIGMIKSLKAKFGLLVLPLAAAVLLFASFAHFELSRRLADGILSGDTFVAASARVGARADSALGVWRDSVQASSA